MRVEGKKLYKKTPFDYNKDVQAYCRKKGEMYGKPNAQSGTYQVGVQISHRIYAQVQEKSDLRAIEKGHTGVYPDVVQIQGRGDNRRTYDAGSCPSVVEYTTENKCVKLHGIPKGEERTDGI